MHSSSASFPVVALAIVGIIATGLVLLCYYIFVIKCCLYWNRIDVTHRLSPAAAAPRGLDEAVIRSIPVASFTEAMPKECAVCLSEFREGERLRVIPNCNHVFHIDCVDVWLQNSRHCPLCRASLSRVPRVFPLHLLGQLGGGSPQGSVGSIDVGVRKKVGGSKGDECIGVRRRDEEFGVQPMRRSFSFDSYGDVHLLRHVREILQRRQGDEAINGSRSRRNFFSFGSAARGSRNSVLPVFFDPS